MKKAIILLILLATVAAIGQTCANGREKKGIFDDVCANGYYLNVDSCCTESLVVPFYVVVIDSLDSLPIPWPWPDCAPCTVFVASDTLVLSYYDTLYIYDTLVISSVDTLWVMGSNGMWFYADKEYVCDSVPISFAADSSESTWCVFCDSIMTVTWYQVTEDGDEIIYDIWRSILTGRNDTCGIVQTAGDVYNYQITYCFDCDTTIYINYGDVYNTYNTGVYVVDSVTGITYGLTDTIWLHPHPAGSTGGSRGIWVADCDCDTAGYGIPDTLDAFLAIDSTWTVLWNSDEANRARCDEMDVISRGYMQSRPPFTAEGPAIAYNATMVNHGGYADGLINYIDTYWLREDSLRWGGEYVSARQVFFSCGDTSIARPEGVWTRKTPNHGACGTQVNWEWPNSLPVEYRAIAMNFHKTINFTDWYSAAEIAALNYKQPDWVIVTFSDDFIPWVSVDRVDYDLDVLATTGDRLGAGAFAYRITPPSDFDYSESHKIAVGLYSCQQPYIGGQVLFSLVMPDSVNVCWTLRDSIILPECDTCANEFTVSGIINQYDVNIETCTGNDTLDLHEHNAWLLSHLTSPAWFMAADSSDSVQMQSVADTIVIDGGVKAKWLITDVINTKGIVADSGQAIVLQNSDGLERAKIYAQNDTVYFSTDTSNITFHFGGSSLIFDDTSMTFGHECKALGYYSIAFGEACSTSELLSVITGGTGNKASSSYSHISNGYYNEASGWGSFIGNGSSNTSSNLYSFIGAGSWNINDGYESFIGCGTGNEITDAQHSFIGGGSGNRLTGLHGAILAGVANTDSSNFSVIIGSNNLLRPDALRTIGIGFSIDIDIDSTIYLKNRDIILDGAVKDPFGRSFLPFWTSGDTLFFEVGDSTWVVVRDSIFANP